MTFTNNIIESQCPVCNSLKTEFDQVHGFYKCLDCKHVWTFDRDDPDHDEGEYLPEKYKSLPGYKDENRKIGGVFGFRHPETGETWNNYE